MKNEWYMKHITREKPGAPSFLCYKQYNGPPELKKKQSDFI